MPLEAKPLFCSDVLRERLKYFNLPATVQVARPNLLRGRDLIASAQLDDHTEHRILPGFRTEFLAKLLGDIGPGITLETPADNLLGRR